MASACLKCKYFPVRCKCEELRLKAENKQFRLTLRRIISIAKMAVGMNPDYSKTLKDCQREAEQALKEGE
jgi:hypothetical protein